MQSAQAEDAVHQFAAARLDDVTDPVSNVFTIPPGLPFLKTLVEKLCSGDLVPGFRYDTADPLSLAGVTIFVPTRRSARVLRSELVDLPWRALGDPADDPGAG